MMTVVVVDSEIYGTALGIAREVSADSMIVEMSYTPPIGTDVTIYFRHAEEAEIVGEIVVRAEVVGHFLSDSPTSCTRSIRMRFVEFVDTTRNHETILIH
jgi:hypothetical protein